MLDRVRLGCVHLVVCKLQTDKSCYLQRGSGPTGKMKQLFETASQLPRSQQQKLAAVLEAFVNQHAA